MNYLDNTEVKFLMSKGFAPANYFPSMKFEYVANLLNEYAMRKLIDIPEEITKDLKILAVKADKDLKNYIQDLLINHVNKSKTSDSE